MKSILSVMVSAVIVFTITACALQTSMSVTTTNGKCANGQTNAPYCMAVTINNNSGGQNWISSTNYPFTNVSVSVSGVSNILSPAGTSSMDPNGCTTNNTIPGSSCTFYLQINQEQYQVGSVTPFTVTIKYTINDGLSAVFGIGGGTQYNYQFTLKEYTNLYSIQQNGINNITVYNNSGFTHYTVESSSGANIYSTTVDNSSYGYLWLATNQGMYWFGNGNTSGNTAYNPSGSTSFSNVFTGQPSPFESSTSIPSSMYGAANANLYSFTFASLSWGSSLTTISGSLMNNVNAVSSAGSNVILASSGQVFQCSTSSSGGCSNEAAAINGIQDVGFTTGVASGYTGLYVGTTNGLFAESGSFPATGNTWQSVTGPSAVYVITTDDDGNLYAGSGGGQIWYVNAESTPVTAQSFATVGSGNISSLVFDNIGNALYVTSGTSLYQCPLSGVSCTLLGSIGNSNTSAGLVIGSSLSS